MRTIRVTGRGQLGLRPDTTRITLTVTGTEQDYSEALCRSAEKTGQLRELIRDHGFSREDLKTLRFQVDTEYESYEENGVYKQRMLGYRYDHTMKLDFPSDNVRLSGILSALTESEIRPELRLSYTVSDPEEAKNELIGKAVADAQGKAAVLAGAAGLALGEIQSIDYSRSELTLEVQPMSRLDGRLSKSAVLDIEPDDISLSDTVTVIWEIV